MTKLASILIVLLLVLACRSGGSPDFPLQNIPDLPGPQIDSDDASAEGLEVNRGHATTATSTPDVTTPPIENPCAASGVVPNTYGAPAVVASRGRSLKRGWLMTPGEVKRGGRIDLDDSAWETVDLPGHWLTKRKSKRLVYWLRHRFDLSKDEVNRGWALDLGGRIGQSEVWLNGERLVEANRKAHAPIYIAPEKLNLRVGTNLLAVKVVTSKAAAGLWWYGDVALGPPVVRQRGVIYHNFKSEVDGSQQTLSLYVPKCVDISKPLPLVLALPGWNGNVHVFSPTGFVAEAEARGALLLVPDPRGNRLYTGLSERGVLEALAVVQRDFKVDPDRIAITGVSMGGAGATQLGYHYPDIFSAVVSIHGDSFYDMETYVARILKTQQRADRYSVLRFAANARNLPVMLIHAQDDPVSDVEQSLKLNSLSKRLGLVNHELIAPLRGGHTLAFVHDFADEAMAFMGRFRRVDEPERVSFRTNAKVYSGAYWLELELLQEGRFGGVDISLRDGVLTVHKVTRGVKRLWLLAERRGRLVEAPLTLSYSTVPGAQIGIKGLVGVIALELQGPESDPHRIDVKDGRVLLPRVTRPGAWTMRWIR